VLGNSPHVVFRVSLSVKPENERLASRKKKKKKKRRKQSYLNEFDKGWIRGEGGAVLFVLFVLENLEETERKQKKK